MQRKGVQYPKVLGQIKYPPTPCQKRSNAKSVSLILSKTKEKDLYISTTTCHAISYSFSLSLGRSHRATLVHISYSLLAEFSTTIMFPILTWRMIDRDSRTRNSRITNVQLHRRNRTIDLRSPAVV